MPRPPASGARGAGEIDTRFPVAEAALEADGRSGETRFVHDGARAPAASVAPEVGDPPRDTPPVHAEKGFSPPRKRTRKSSPQREESGALHPKRRGDAQNLAQGGFVGERGLSSP